MPTAITVSDLHKKAPSALLTAPASVSMLKKLQRSPSAICAPEGVTLRGCVALCRGVTGDSDGIRTVTE